MIIKIHTSRHLIGCLVGWLVGEMFVWLVEEQVGGWLGRQVGWLSAGSHKNDLIESHEC